MGAIGLIAWGIFEQTEDEPLSFLVRWMIPLSVGYACVIVGEILKYLDRRDARRRSQ